MATQGCGDDGKGACVETDPVKIAKNAQHLARLTKDVHKNKCSEGNKSYCDGNPVAIAVFTLNGIAFPELTIAQTILTGIFGPPKSTEDHIFEVAAQGSPYIRYMTRAELSAIYKTGYLRGGNPGLTFFTSASEDSVFETVGGATSRLALKTPPEVGALFEINNNPTIIGPESVEPLYGRMGEGIEFLTFDQVEVEILNVWDLLP